MGPLPFLQCTGETSRPGLPRNPGIVAICFLLPCMPPCPAGYFCCSPPAAWPRG